MASSNGDVAPIGRSWPQRLLLLLGVVSVVALVGAASAVAYLGNRFDQVEKYDVALTPPEPGQPANYLIVGSDSRDAISASDPNSGAFLHGAADGRRSDTILIARIDPRAETASLLSLPRDLWVPIAGTDKHQRINAAYGMGRQVLSDTIQDYLGIPINHYVEVDFKGFSGLVQAIDGVPMYFERAMKDTNSGLDVLHPGCVTLDGPSALAFARSRHLEYIERGVWRSDPTGDLGRITRQQILVRRAIGRATSKGLTNPLTLKRLIDVGVSNVGVDVGLSPKGLADLGRRFAHFGGDDLSTFTLPTTAFRTDGGADVLALDEQAAVPTLDLFRTVKGQVPDVDGPVAAPTGSGSAAVSVLNGSGQGERAANVAGALQQVGFGITYIGDVSDIGGTVVDHSEIRFRTEQQAAAELLARHLPSGARLVPDDSIKPDRVVLVVGRDFTKVSMAASGPAATTVAPLRPTAGDTSSSVPPVSGPATTQPVGRTPGEVPPGVSCG